MSPRQQSLSRERIVKAAIRVADRGGAEAITMRRVAQQLGVEAMSLYHHVPNKDALLDGVVDAVYADIELPDPACGDWRDAIRARAHSARTILSRHSWALGLMDSRHHPGPVTLRHLDAVLGVLRQAGFTLPLAAHAVSLIDSYTNGYVLQEATLPARNPGDVELVAGEILRDLPAEQLPNLREMIVGHALRPGYDHTTEFAFGLDLILDALEDRRKTTASEQVRARARGRQSRSSAPP